MKSKMKYEEPGMEITMLVIDDLVATSLNLEGAGGNNIQMPWDGFTNDGGGV